MNKLQQLIEEGKKLSDNITYVNPPRNVLRTFAVYEINDKGRYYLWLNQSKNLLIRNFKFNPLVDEFINLSKEITPNSHLQMVSILEAMLDDYSEHPSLSESLQELEKLEREYTNIKDSEGAGVQVYAVQYFHKWYEYAVKVFFNLVGENDPDFQMFKNINAAGNVYVLSHEYDMIHASYVILKEKLKNPTRWGQYIQLPLPTRTNLITAEKTNIFISYSHCDKKYLKWLQKHLKAFQRQNQQIEIWDDTKIQIGDKWKKEIESALDNTSIAFLLISKDFLASDFVMDNEIPTLLQKSSNEGTMIIPIILSPCLFEDSPISEFQAINPPEKPLSMLSESEVDQIFVDLLRQIKNRF